MHRIRTLIALFLACGLALGAAACGDDDATEDGNADGTDSNSGDETSDGAVDAPDGPVEVDHAFGTTTIDAVPERIVTLGSQWTDAALSLGAEPVAWVDDNPDADFPWQSDDLPAEATELFTTDGIPFEQIATLDPDLILATHVVVDQTVYDQLAGIAPTIAALGDREVDRWQEQTALLAEILGRPGDADEVVGEIDTLTANVAAEFPNLDGATYSFANYLPGDSIYVVADPDDGASEFFSTIGLEIAPDLVDVADGATGRAQLSLEQAGLLTADLVMVLANGGDPMTELPGFADIPAVAAGAYVDATLDLAIALNTPSARSLTWALEQIRPVFAEVTAG